jgi:hypothetical protein
MKHIAMEEKLVIPAATAARDGKPLHIARQLRFEHGALAALLIPPPTNGVLTVIRKLFKHHHYLEEGEGGLYEVCERLNEETSADILTKAQNFQDIVMLPNSGADIAYEAAIRALEKAGVQATAGELR